MYPIRQEIPENLNFSYIDNGPDKRFEVKSQLPEPLTLIKFYRLTNFNVEAFTKNYLYGCHPLELNDPFDSLRWAFGENFSSYMGLFQKLGLISFCHPENSENILMWAHYCNNQGISIEFDPGTFSFQHHGPFPMNYLPSIPQNISFKTDFIRNLFFLTLKYDIWKYENEWRIFPESKGILKCPKINNSDYPEHNFLDRKFSYDPGSVKSVTLGYRFTFDECNVFDKNNGTIYINTSNQLKIAILEKILENKYPVFLIDSKPGYEFVLEEKPVEISKLSELEYRFKFL